MHQITKLVPRRGKPLCSAPRKPTKRAYSLPGRYCVIRGPINDNTELVPLMPLLWKVVRVECLQTVLVRDAVFTPFFGNMNGLHSFITPV